MSFYIYKNRKNWNNYCFDFINKNSNKYLNWNAISNNPNFTIEIVVKYPDKPWIWSNNYHIFSKKVFI